MQIKGIKWCDSFICKIYHVSALYGSILTVTDTVKVNYFMTSHNHVMTPAITILMKQNKQD